jgi:hypothetical protein
MAQDAAEPRRTRTLAVSNDFGDMITFLAKEAGLSVEAYCDKIATTKFAPEYEAALSAKLSATKRRTQSTSSKKG